MTPPPGCINPAQQATRKSTFCGLGKSSDAIGGGFVKAMGDIMPWVMACRSGLGFWTPGCSKISRMSTEYMESAASWRVSSGEKPPDCP